MTTTLHDVIAAQSFRLRDLIDTGAPAGGGAPTPTVPLFELKLDEGSGNPVDTGSVQPSTAVPLTASTSWFTDPDGTGLEYVGPTNGLFWPPGAHGADLHHGAVAFRVKYTATQTMCLNMGFNVGLTGLQVQLNNGGVANAHAVQFRDQSGVYNFGLNFSAVLNDGLVHDLMVRWGASYGRMDVFIDGAQVAYTDDRALGVRNATYAILPNGCALGALQNGVEQILGYVGKLFKVAYYPADATLSGILEHFGNYTPEAGEVLTGPAWTWFNSETAIRNATHSFVNGITMSGAVEVARISHASGEVDQRAVIDPGSMPDDHGDAGTFIDPEGHYQALWQDHTGPEKIRRRRTLNPGDISSWGPMTEVPITSIDTYAQVHPLLSGRIVVLYRGADKHWHYILSDDNGESWFGETKLIAWSPGDVGYLVTSCDGVSVFGGTTRANVGESRFDVGYFEFRPDTEEVYRADQTLVAAKSGAPSGFPIAYLGADTVYLSAADKYDWVQHVAKGRVLSGRFPRVGSGVNHELVYSAHAGGTSWDTNVVANVGNAITTRRESYSPLGCLDLNDTNRVYVAANVNGANHTLSRYETANGGASWTSTALVGPQAKPIFRPRCPASPTRAADPSAEVFYLEGDYDDFVVLDPTTGWRTKVKKVAA